PAELVGVFDAGVVEGLEAVGRLRSQVEAVGFALAAEASARGLPMAVGLSLVDWLRVRCPWLSKEEACQVRQVVRAGEAHWGTGLAEAVRSGRVPVHRGARVARTMIRLAGSLSPEEREAYAGIVTDAAGNPDLSDAELGLVCKKLLVDLLEEKPRRERARTAQGLRCVSSRPLGSGMT
ncbi:hypothetical protein, partial [Ornithinimicrobium cavernae]|uniref:hypothetical protein n=1 Tax=Ornithinimicrobium cavernae TaxID=2666047 RepID=UPI001379E210